MEPKNRIEEQLSQSFDSHVDIRIKNIKDLDWTKEQLIEFYNALGTAFSSGVITFVNQGDSLEEAIDKNIAIAYNAAKFIGVDLEIKAKTKDVSE